MGTHWGKRAVGTFIVGVRSSAGRQPPGGGKRKQGPVGAPAPKSTGRAASGTSAPKRSRLPAVGGGVRVHGLVPDGPKVVLVCGSVGSRTATRGRLHRRGNEGVQGSASRPQKVPRRGEGSEGSRPVGESAGGAASAVGVTWKFKPRGGGGATQLHHPVKAMHTTGLGGGMG